MKKLFTLLTLLVCLCTGAWGDDLCSAYLSGTENTPTVTNCTLKFFGQDGEGAGTVVAGSQVGTTAYYAAKMNNDKNYYEITLNWSSGTATSTKFRAGDVITVYLQRQSGTQAYKVGKTAQTAVSASNSADASVVGLEHTLTAAEIETDGTVRIYRNSSNTYFAGVKVSGSRNTEAFTVTYNAEDHGSCGTESTTETKANDGVVLPDVTPESGYAFNGWYTAASGGTKIGNAGATYFPTESITLHAQYIEQVAPGISIDNDNPSIYRGGAITFTANTTGAPAPTVTWYQSETATTSGGVEKGTGTTYDPDVTTPGTYYYYAIAANGVSPDATSELITLTVTNPDVDRTGYNTYYVAEAETAVNGKKILCDDITMTFVNTTGAFNAAIADNNINSINSNFVASISGDNSSSGWGVTFTPTSNGTLSVGVIINNGRTFTITNATSFTYNGTSAGSNASNSWVPAEKQYTIVTFNVTKGTTYTLSVAGSKMGLYGFEFVKDAPAPTTTETTDESATFTGTSTVTATSTHISATGAIKSGSTIQGLSTGMKLESGSGTITITLPAGAKNASVVLLADGNASKLKVDNTSTSVSSSSVTGGGYNITVSLPDNATTNDATHTIAKDSNPSIYKISLSYEIDLDKAYLTTTANMAGWRAFCDANNGYTLDNNTTAYVATASGDGKVTLTPLAGGVPSGTAVILHTSSSAESYKMTLTKANVNAYEGTNLLTWETTAVDSKYRLGYGADGVGFYPYSGTPASGAVILDVSSASQTPAKALTLAFSDVTGISGVSAKKAVSTGKRYNLSGQLVGEDYKGIVIENGKKYIK